MVPQAVHTVMQRASEEALQVALEDASAFFWVEWREDDDQIPGLCEGVLKTGQLSADWGDDDSLAIVFRGKRFRVPLTQSVLTWVVNSWLFYSVYWILPSFITDFLLWPSRGNRHITLIALNQALGPDYEVRVVKKSLDGSEAAFLPLAAADWRELERQYGPATVGAVFGPIEEHHNLFTEMEPLAGSRLEQA